MSSLFLQKVRSKKAAQLSDDEKNLKVLLLLHKQVFICDGNEIFAIHCIAIARKIFRAGYTMLQQDM